MPIRKDIKKVLVIGSGPIVIGQAAEFDYAGTQALKALKEENLKVVLVNSNPATIMTDRFMADSIYIEPLTIQTVKKIIKMEKPDSLLSIIGGQTGLNLAMQLSKDNFLKEHNIKLLGASLQTIQKAEDRNLFKQAMNSIGEPVIESETANSTEKALEVLKNIGGLPVVIRPAFTLGGSGGGIAKTKEEFLNIVKKGLLRSPIKQVLIEKSIAGWKEIEFELIRDSNSNIITVCAMENIDPIGIHTGDSIVVAPTLTLSDKEYQMLRTASIKIIEELKVQGGCNCQFAFNPKTLEYAVIEVNPRVSRSSALASKATGYPIAKVATKVAIGFHLNEILNQITKKTYACFEPALDYVVLKFPKWPFDKFIYAKRNLGPQMKSTGEVMSIATNFEQALMKSIRGAEINQDTLSLKEFSSLTEKEILEKLTTVDDKRIFLIYEAIKKNISIEKIESITKIDGFFLHKIKNLAEMEKLLREEENGGSNFVDENIYQTAKKLGFLDSSIEKLTKKNIKNKMSASFKMVDSCAAEFLSSTPYFYSEYATENEAKSLNNGEKKVLVLGSGPIRIGQGIEFDYCCVHCVWALKKLGFKALICNNNPETVSTDFDIGDKLYFEPVEFEDVLNIIKTENPIGVILQFGGQTAIKLAKMLSEMNIKILGTSPQSIDIAEDREKFDALLEKFSIPRPKGYSVFSTDEALKAAKTLKYPVLLRPSYVLGGQNMIIAYDDEDLKEYMKIITKNTIKNPVLIDKYITGIEAEVDAICDGTSCLIPGIMEHIERAGVHSGDSISVYPCQNLSQKIIDKIVQYTKIIAIALNVKGLLNIQFVIHDDDVFIIEANPRSSRTVPYISKVTNIPMVEIATRVIFGEKIKNLPYGEDLIKNNDYVAVKVPVFSFEKLNDVDVYLGPEMKSTGEVLGVADNFSDALFKGLLAAGYNMKYEDKKGVLITVKDRDKPEIVSIAKKFKELGFTIYATRGTASYLEKNMISCITVFKAHESQNSTLDLIENKKVDLIISTSNKDKLQDFDSVKIRRKSVEFSIPCLTCLDTALAYTFSLSVKNKIQNVKLVDINKSTHQKTHIT